MIKHIPERADAFPLGDPVDRLRRHLVTVGGWDDERHQALQESIDAEVTEAFRIADRHGSAKSGHTSDPSTIFDDVYATPPRHLVEQRERIGG